MSFVSTVLDRVARAHFYIMADIAVFINSQILSITLFFTCLSLIYLLYRHKYLPFLSLPHPKTSPPLPPPTEILDLRIYPIKSCRGFSVRSTQLLKTGLDLDRQWMFVDARTGVFLTIRQLAKMTLIETAVDPEADTLTISIATDLPKDDSKTSIVIPAHPSEAHLKANTTLAPCTIWSHQTDGWHYPAALTEPISAFLGREVRLVRKGPKPRVLGGNGSPSLLGRTQTTAFADVLPLQVASAASMTELNQRLAAAFERADKGGSEPKADASAFTIERFRPNVIVRGGEPWSEDEWKTVMIGNVVKMDVVARCARCRVPNVNPETASEHKREPWDTLMKYRRVDEGIKFKPCFGMLCVPRNEGNVSVGMRFEVLETTSEHRYARYS